MRTLLTPLDWGLGHATRSLALAEQLRRAGDELVWASAGPALDLLRRELPPGEPVHELPAYDVRYATSNMVWNVATQAFKWARTLGAEGRATAELVRRYRPDRIVSDSRFGCYHPEVESIFLTHQLHPLTGFAPANAVYRWHLNRHFNRFWVPDFPGEERLSGQLSDARGYGKVDYIGQLSRLRAGVDSTLPPVKPLAERPAHLLLLLSGPEPARTRLEDRLLRSLPEDVVRMTLIRGLPVGAKPLRVDSLSPNFSYLDYADRVTLTDLLQSVDLVLCRSGYSTLMDLRALGKPALLIPTPGQTEQIYLARRAAARGWARNFVDDRSDNLLDWFA